MTIKLFQLDYSPRDIPIPPKTSYIKDLIHRTEDFIKRLRWKAFFFLKKLEKKDESGDQASSDDETQGKETFGFRSENTPPRIPLLDPFETDLWNMIASINFDSDRSPFQKKLANDVKRIKESNKVLVHADKTNNIYEVDPDTYRNLLRDNITQDYKIAEDKFIDNVNLEAKNITSDLNIEDRVEKMNKDNAYITLKDHKPNFNSQPKCRLINPAKSEVGIISRDYLQKINASIRSNENLNQWRNTDDVIKWFKDIKNPTRKQFIQYDVVNYYPSISEELMKRALKFAAKYHYISKQMIKTILNARKSFLFNNSKSWTKKDGLFDVTMGAYDGAEICELVGLYMLYQLRENISEIHFGLYRDDGLGVYSKLPGPTLERLKKKIIEIFKMEGLSITIETKLHSVNFLDITMNLLSNQYHPYRKPNDNPIYINASSNHPPTIIKRLPDMINKRLSSISCDERAFNDAKPIYEAALRRGGHSRSLNYEKPKPKRKDKRTRERKIVYYNPPFNATVKTNIGKRFLQLIDTHFPANHKLRKIINRNNVKIGYSCTRNISTIIKQHNSEILSNREKLPISSKCNCRQPTTCPLNGNCQQSTLVYEATVKDPKTNTTHTYIGSTEGNFKTRYYQHKSDFKIAANKHKTTLSKRVWKCKEGGSNPEISWSVRKTCRAYPGRSRKCDVCLTEKMEILLSCDPTLLNSRTELVSKCRHQQRFRLADVKRKRK